MFAILVLFWAAAACTKNMCPAMQQPAACATQLSRVLSLLFFFGLFLFLLSLCRHLMRGQSFFGISLSPHASIWAAQSPATAVACPPQSCGSDCSSSTQSRKTLAAADASALRHDRHDVDFLSQADRTEVIGAPPPRIELLQMQTEHMRILACHKRDRDILWSLAHWLHT